MENFSFNLLWGDARTLLFSSATLAGSALVGILAYVLLFKFIDRISRRSTSTLQLLVAKQTRAPARYILPLFALTIALPVTTLSERFKSAFEHFNSIGAIEGRSPNADQEDTAAQWKAAMAVG